MLAFRKPDPDDDEGKRRPEDIDRGVGLPANTLDRHQTVTDREQDAAEQNCLALAEISVGQVPAEQA